MDSSKDMLRLSPTKEGCEQIHFDTKGIEAIVVHMELHHFSHHTLYTTSTQKIKKIEVFLKIFQVLYQSSNVFNLQFLQTTKLNKKNQNNLNKFYLEILYRVLSPQKIIH